MSILRALFLLLVLLNLLLFAAGQGYFGRSGSGEPERLNNQISPEKIAIVREEAVAGAAQPAEMKSGSAAQARAATQVATELATQVPTQVPTEGATQMPTETCRRYPALARDKVARIAELARGRSARIDLSQKPLGEPTSFWVYIPPQPNREELDKRIAELKAAGVKDHFIEQKEGPNHYAISLGVFKSDRMAQDLRERLRAKGITNARTLARDSGSGKVALELRGAAEELKALTAQIGSEFPGLSTKDCAAGR